MIDFDTMKEFFNVNVTLEDNTPVAFAMSLADENPVIASKYLWDRRPKMKVSKTKAIQRVSNYVNRSYDSIKNQYEMYGKDILLCPRYHAFLRHHGIYPKVKPEEFWGNPT